jgi:hypothetical protein
MASLEKQPSVERKGDAAHVEDAARVLSRGSSEKEKEKEQKDFGALEAQTPSAQNEVS